MEFEREGPVYYHPIRSKKRLRLVFIRGLNYYHAFVRVAAADWDTLVGAQATKIVAMLSEAGLFICLLRFVPRRTF